MIWQALTILVARKPRMRTPFAGILQKQEII
jgi:hypothetical protein